MHSMNSCMAHSLKQTFVEEPALSIHLARQAYAIVTSFSVFSAIGTLYVISKFPAAEASTKNQDYYFRVPSLKWMILSCLGVLLTVLAWNTWRLENNQVNEPLKPIQDENESKKSKAFLANVLSKCIQFRTISFDPDSELKPDHTQLQGLIKYLSETFPLCFQKLNPQYLGHNGEKFSTLFEWSGTNKTLKPAIFCSHLDVVPCPEEKKWTHPPFLGTISKDGVVWGRGAIDNKHNVVTQLFAIESFLRRGVRFLFLLLDLLTNLLTHPLQVRPKRTLYICMGHDEEIGA